MRYPPEKIAEARRLVASGWTQARVAEHLDVSVHSVHSWWQQRRRPASYTGEGLPEAAKPAEGFEVFRNSGQFDADGKLEKQWVESRRAPGEEYAVPAGHVVKGESALLDPDGRVLAKWVKTKEGASGPALMDALRAAFLEHDGGAGVVPRPAAAEDDLLTVYPLPDLHLGMYAWGRETGAPYDLGIAHNAAVQGVADLVAQSRPSKRAVILGLGDYFHQNDQTNATPAHRHRLDVDGRWPKVFAAGARLATMLVDLVARRHQEVEVVFLPGNHDPDAAVCLTVALALFYGQNERIQVHQEPGIAWYRRHGRVLLGATHGHTMKPDRMAMMLANDRAEDWGQSTFRHMFFGHVHHESAKAVGSVMVESLTTPAAPDGHAASHGYRTMRALSAITFHQTRGEIGRHRVNIVDAAAA